MTRAPSLPALPPPAAREAQSVGHGDPRASSRRPRSLRVTAAGYAAATSPERAPLPPAYFDVVLALGDGHVSLRADGGDAAAWVLGQLAPGQRVEVRLVGEADGSHGSVRRAGERSGWGGRGRRGA